MAILVIFWSIFGDRKAYFGLIDFKNGLYIKVNVTARRNKFEVYIYQFAQNGHQLAQNKPYATFAHGHYLAITWSFFIQFLALFPLVQILVFAPVFAPRPHMGSIALMDTKLPSKSWDVSWPSPPTPNYKSFFTK